MIQAGELNRRITIQQASETLDDAGQPVRTWSTFAADLPTKVESVTGGEQVRGRQVAAEAGVLFTVRWLAGVTAEMRVVFDSENYGIVRVADPYGDRRELRIECKRSDQS